MNDTVWRPIVGYENEYLVNRNGEVFSVRRNKKIKPGKDKDGYLYFVFSVNGKRATLKAHRIVAKAFVENPLNKPTVNHKNGIRNDNRAENLEWATIKEQANDELTRANVLKVVARTDYFAMGLKRDFGRRKTTAYKQGKLIGIFNSLKEVVHKYGLNYGKASECANGKRKEVGGYKLCYV